MITKFFTKSGVGGSGGVLDYMLGKDRDRERAKVIRGDEEITGALIDSINYARNYTSGCLSFSESDISESQKEEIMQSFENTLLAGLDEDQRNFLWIEHKDKGRLELNFVIPNVELKTGNRLQPFYSRADKELVNAWQEIQNIKHKFSDPNDPSKRRSLSMAHNTPKLIEEAKKSITEGLMTLAQNGIVKNRDDVLLAFKEAGFEITRETSQSISIKNPDNPNGRNIRLKGFIYERNFKLSPEFQKDLRATSEDFKNSSRERLERAESELGRKLQAKHDYNKQRYDREPKSTQKQNERAITELVEQFKSIRERAEREKPENQKQSDNELGDNWNNYPLDNVSNVRCTDVFNLESEIRLRETGANQSNIERANGQYDLEQVRWETLRSNESKLPENKIWQEERSIYDSRSKGLNDDRKTIIDSIRDVAGKSRNTGKAIDDFCSRTTTEFNTTVQHTTTRFNEFNQRTTSGNQEIARNNESLRKNTQGFGDKAQQFIERTKKLYSSIIELLIKKNAIKVTFFNQKQILKQDLNKKTSFDLDR